MPNISGPYKLKRSLLCSVVDRQILYAAPVWPLTVSASDERQDELPATPDALRTIRAYRSVSNEAALLSGTPLVNLVAAEKDRIKVKVSQDSVPIDPPF